MEVGGIGIPAQGLIAGRMEGSPPSEKSAYEIQHDQNVARVQEAVAPTIAAREEL